MTGLPNWDKMCIWALAHFERKTLGSVDAAFWEEALMERLYEVDESHCRQRGTPSTREQALIILIV